LRSPGAIRLLFSTRHTTRTRSSSYGKRSTNISPGQQVYLIFGASEDKNIPGMFEEMKPKIRKLIVTRADHPRALQPGQIIELADQAGVESEAVSPVEAALVRALELSKNDGSIVLSAGSMFVTAEVMQAWNKIALNPNSSPIGRGAKG
jgi:folylpolyglutamate synthase/dihydropteroate synthase